MKIVWNEQSVRWFRNASEYTGYNRKLAEILLVKIPRRNTLCDIGCGAGMIDFELAPHFNEITCVDISPVAANSVAEHAKRIGVKNISALCMDARELNRQWETVIALFHGEENAIAKYLTYTSNRLIWVTHGRKKINFGPKNHKLDKSFDMHSVKTHLDKVGVKYSHSEHELEYGQPFCDIQEAETFVQAYATPMRQDDLNSYLSQNLLETGDAKFPYYLPNRKTLSVFVIQKDKKER